LFFIAKEGSYIQIHLSINILQNRMLYENITRYILDNVGNIFTAKKVADYLKSQKLKVSIETVQNYIAYPVPR